MTDTQLERLAALASELISESNFDILSDLYKAEKRRLNKKPILEADLKTQYREICMEYIEKFCLKQDMYFEDADSKELDGNLFCSGFHFHFSDVKTDIDMRAPKGAIIRYWDYCSELLGKSTSAPINYRNFLIIYYHEEN
jgi:hypothetical protein